MKYIIITFMILNLICLGTAKCSQASEQEKVHKEVSVKQKEVHKIIPIEQEEVIAQNEGFFEGIWEYLRSKGMKDNQETSISQLDFEQSQQGAQAEAQVQEEELLEEAKPEQVVAQGEVQSEQLELQEETKLEQQEVKEEIKPENVEVQLVIESEQKVAQEGTQAEQKSYLNISPNDLYAMLQTPERNFLFINTHIPYQGEIESTDNFIPSNEIEIYFPALPKDKNSEIVVYDLNGDMSKVAAETLAGLGYTNIKNLTGGMIAWQEAGYELHDAFGKREDLTTPDMDRVSSQIGVPRHRFIKVDTTGDPYIGSLETPLVLVEFSDFNCPYCARFHSETLPKIVQTYVETNQLRYVYRDLVSVGGALSFGAAVAAECTREQIDDSNYFVLVNQLYASSGRKNMEGLINLASNMEVNLELVLDCLEAKSYEQEVAEDQEAALSTGARGTPVFVLGFQIEDNLVEGIVFQGVLPIEMLSNYINAFLESSAIQ